MTKDKTDKPKIIIPEEMRIANHNICTLSTIMRDCPACPFNIGMVYDVLELLKQAESPAIMPEKARKIYHQKLITLSL